MGHTIETTGSEPNGRGTRETIAFMPPPFGSCALFTTAHFACVRYVNFLCGHRQTQEHRAFPAYLHLLTPVLLHLALADGAVDEPAEVPCLKFPRGAVVSDLLRTSLDGPARSDLLILRRLQGHEKEDLAFRVHGNVAPSLLEALYGFGRDT